MWFFVKVNSTAGFSLKLPFFFFFLFFLDKQDLQYPGKDAREDTRRPHPQATDKTKQETEERWFENTMTPHLMLERPTLSKNTREGKEDHHYITPGQGKMGV